MDAGMLLVKIKLDTSELDRGLKQVQQQISDAGKQMSTGFRDSFEKIGNIGKTISAGFSAPMAGFAALVTEGVNELRGDLARLQQNAKDAGVSIGTVNESFKDMYALTGEADSSVEALSNVLATGFKDADNFQAIMDNLAGAAIKFSDTLKLEGIADGLQETLATGAAIGPFAELLERSGVALDDFNAGLQAAISNGTQEQYVLDRLASLGLAKTYEEYQKNNAAMLEYNKNKMDLQMGMVELGNTILPVISKITGKISEWIESFNNLDGSTQKIILAVGGLIGVLAPILTMLPSLAAGFAMLATPIGLAVAALGAAPIEKGNKKNRPFVLRAVAMVKEAKARTKAARRCIA